MNRRLCVASAVAAGALLVTGCSSDPGPGSTASEDGAHGAAAARAAADWLLADVGEAGLLEVTTAYEGSTSTNVDHGSSIDLVLGLSAIGHADQDAAAITDAVADDLATYVGAEGEVYAGPSAKALVLAVDQDRDARDFGGTDLRRRVERTVTQGGPAKGRITDTSEWGDYANTLGQAYAVLGLTRVDSDRARDATDFLLAQQCSEGFFRLDFSGPKKADQSCDGAKVEAEQSPDVTSLVVLQLAPLAEEDEEVATALEAAGEWLTEQQAEDGSFSDPGNGTNANSVGLAGQALRVLGEDEAADRAAAWLGDVQVDEDEEGELAEEVGAVAYDPAALEEGRTHGITDPLDRSQWLLAGVQAFPALAEDLAGRS